MALHINIHKLYDLFFHKNLVDVKGSKSRYPMLPKSPIKTKSSITDLSPISKMIYEQTSPRSQSHLLLALLEDTMDIEKIESKDESSDPDYQDKLEHGGLGFFMENIVSCYGRCPVCKEKSLKKYMHSNIPVVDLVCINISYHRSTGTCFLYQVKISLTSDYFNFRNKTISVGSRTYGDLAHSYKGSSNILEKIVVPGYICIKMNQPSENIQQYTINKNHSFVLVPDYQNTLDKNYYSYLVNKNFFGKNLIKWDPDMVDESEITDMLDDMFINPDIYSFEENILDNPYKFIK